MNMKEMVTSIVTAMLVMTMFASSAMAITVDGAGSDWTSGFLASDPEWNADPDLTADLYGYDIAGLWQYYDNGADILYFRLDVSDIPGDLDGNNDPDTVCGSAPYDCPGVGAAEQYTLTLSSTGHTNVYMRYSSNSATHPAMVAACGYYVGGCVEMSLSSASSYVNPYDYCIHVSAGGDSDGEKEDEMNVCHTDNPPDANFGYTGTGCMEVTLDASTSTDLEGPIVKYEWDLGNDGTYEINNGVNPIFVADVATTALNVGPNTIRLRVTDNTGQTDWTNTPQVIVTGHPTATAMANGVTGSITLPPGGGMVTLTGTATPYATTTITSTTWSIPGATPSAGTGLGLLMVSVLDTTTATLTVAASNGCLTPASVLIRVEGPQQEVPILTLPGLLALIGMMCIVGAGRIITRGRRS